MGNRTVVILYNDQSYQWENDPQLGKKISVGMNNCYAGRTADLGYGRVVECAHADTNTFALLEGYRWNPIVQTFWNNDQTYEEIKIGILRAWADKEGYRLVKKSKEKE